MTEAVSPVAAMELAAAATAAHPYSQLLWQQMRELVSAGPGQHSAAALDAGVLQEAAQRGLMLPPPSWQPQAPGRSWA